MIEVISVDGFEYVVRVGNYLMYCEDCRNFDIDILNGSERENVKFLIEGGWEVVDMVENDEFD